MRSVLVSLGCYKKTPAYAGHLILTILKAEKFKFRMLTDLVPSENSLPGLQRTAFSLCPHRVGREREREHVGALASLTNLIRALILSRVPPS